MNLIYETDRLILKVLRPEAAKKVLCFYLENKELFEKYQQISKYSSGQFLYRKIPEIRSAMRI